MLRNEDRLRSVSARYLSEKSATSSKTYPSLPVKVKGTQKEIVEVWFDSLLQKPRSQNERIALSPATSVPRRGVVPKFVDHLVHESLCDAVTTARNFIVLLFLIQSTVITVSQILAVLFWFRQVLRVCLTTEY